MYLRLPSEGITRSVKTWILSPQKEVSNSLLKAHAILKRLPELLNIHNAFHQGQYPQVISFDTTAFSPENAVPAQVLKYRAQIASGQAKAVLDSITKEADRKPEYAAVKALAQYSLGQTNEAQQEIEKLLETSLENAVVQVMGGTVLQAVGRTEDALGLLSKHQGNLEAYACMGYSPWCLYEN